MKKCICWIAVLLMIVSLCGCKKTNVNPEAVGTTVPGDNVVEGQETETTVETTEATAYVEEAGKAGGQDDVSAIVQESVGEFVPSITYKGNPFVVSANLDGVNARWCLVVTNVDQARKMETDISPEDAELLLEVYEKLLDGSMVLPIERDYVIRELVNVDFAYYACQENEAHGDKGGVLAKEGIILNVVFDLDIDASQAIMVMVYINDEWVEVPAKVGSNGHVTCEFEDVCPVAFVILK